MLNRFGFRWMMVLSAVSLVAAGCRTQRFASSTGSTNAAAAGDFSRTKASVPAETETEFNSRVEAHARYATALIRELNGDSAGAMDEYYEAALHDLGNEALVLEVSRALIQAKQNEKALKLLQFATSRAGASGVLFARLGFVYFQLGQADFAISSNREAIKRAPRSLVGYQNLFLIYLQTKQAAEALRVLDQAAKTSPAPPEFLIGLGELYASYALQNASQRDTVFERGFQVLQRAAKENITDPTLQLRLADAFTMVGRTDEAAQAYQQMVRQSPDSPMSEIVRAKLAEIYLRDRDQARATEQLEGMVRDNPTDPQAYYYLGSLAFAGTNFARATEFFSKVIVLEPNFEQAYYDLAGAQISDDKSADALATLEKARAKFPQKYAGEYLTGFAYERQNDYTNAMSHYTSAEVIAQVNDPKQLKDSFYFHLGATCERMGDIARAEKYFQKCLELSPNFSEAQNYLGYMLADHDQKLDYARDLIAKAVQAEPKNAAYLDSMGWVLFKLKQLDKALAYMLDAVKYSEEEDATLYDHLGEIYAALQQPQQAAEAWRKSLSLEDNAAVRQKLDATTNRGAAK